MKRKELLFISGLFILLVLIFFHQVLFGLLPIPADLIAGAYYPWLDYKWGFPAGVPVKNPILSDVVSVIYPIKALAVDLIRRGELPLWNWQMLGGYPLFANFQLGLLFPSMVFYLLFNTPLAWTFQVMLQPLLALTFMYLFLRHLKLGFLPSLFGAISYAFGGFAMIWLEWNILSTASAFLPLLILLEDKFLQTGDTKWSVLFSLALSLQILAGYPQIVAFSLLGVLWWFIWQSRSGFSGIKLAVFILLGLGLAGIFLLPGMEQFYLSQRRVERIDATFAFLPWQYLTALLSPDYFGNHSTGNFWGVGEYTLLTLYSGLVTIILAMTAAIFPKKQIFCFLTLTLVALFIMLPQPISSFLYNLGLWGGGGASTTRAAFLINFSLSAMGAFGLSLLSSKANQKITRPSLYIFSTVAGLTMGTFITKFYLQDQAYLVEQTIKNLDVALRNLFLPIFFSFTVCLLIFLNYRKIIPAKLLQILLILLVTIELFRFGLKFNSFSPPKLLYPSTPVTNFLKEHPQYRILGGEVIPSNMWVPDHLESASGYDAVFPLTWAKFLSLVNTNNPKTDPAGRFGLINTYNFPLFDLTGTKYLLALKRDQDRKIKGDGQIDPKFNLPKFKTVFQDKSVVVLENLQTFPRAFLVSKVITLSPDDTLKQMTDPGFSFHNTAIVNPEAKIPSDLFAGINNQENLPLPVYRRLANNHIQITTDSPKEAFLVVLDSFYPGWEAKVDSTPSEIYPTNFSFRGIKIPAGKHKIDLTYFPRSLKVGALISLSSLSLLLVVIFFPRLFGNYDKKT